MDFLGQFLPGHPTALHLQAQHAERLAAEERGEEYSYVDPDEDSRIRATYRPIANSEDRVAGDDDADDSDDLLLEAASQEIERLRELLHEARAECDQAKGRAFAAESALEGVRGELEALRAEGTKGTEGTQGGGSDELDSSDASDQGAAALPSAEGMTAGEADDPAGVAPAQPASNGKGKK